MLILLIKKIFLCFLPPDVEREHEELVPNIVGRENSINKATRGRTCINVINTIERENSINKATRGRTCIDVINTIERGCKVEREYMDTEIPNKKLREDVAELTINSRTVIPPIKSIDFIDGITQYHSKDLNHCEGCSRIFSFDFKRLAFQSPNNPRLCIGCKSLLDSTSKFDTKHRFNHHNKNETINISHETNFMQYLHQHKTQNHSVFSAGLLYHLPLSTNYYLKQRSRRNHVNFVYHISYPEENKVSHFTTYLGCQSFVETRRRTLVKATDSSRTKGSCRASGYVASIEELLDLMVKANSTCALSGAKGIWITTPGYPNYTSFVLSLDHKIPMSKGGGSHVDNLQASLQCFNNIKGSHSSDEFQNWLNAFKQQQGC